MVKPNYALELRNEM